MIKFIAFLLVAIPFAASATDRCDEIADVAIGAALDDPGSAYNLGVAFYTGRCTQTPKSYANAAKVWRKAADLGVVPAKNNLGYLLHTGLAGQEDKTEAVRLWTDAAKTGFPESQSHLGSAYFDGAGVPKDQVKGLAWVLLAIESAPQRAASAEGGGGEAVLADALKEKARMLKTAPKILNQAEALKTSLLANER